MTARLERISPDHLSVLEIEHRMPTEIKSTVDVDKFWEHIMYIFGNGNVGMEPTVWTFSPDNIRKAKEEGDYIVAGIYS